MTDGAFKTWEMFALMAGLTVCVISGFIGRIGDLESEKPFLISVMLMSAALFAKPVWLLGNWKEIKTWEKTTALVYESFFTRHRRGIVRRHISIEFTSENGRTIRRTILNVGIGFKKGQKRGIMFKEEYMEALIFVPRAFRQAVVSAVLGVLIESGAVLSFIMP